MSVAPTARSPGHRKRALVVLAGLGMLVYVGLALKANPEALERALGQLGWTGVGLVLSASLFNYILRFQRWHLYLAELGHKLPWGHHFLVYLGGFLFTVSPAKAGEAVRGVYLHEHGVSYSDTFAALFVERLLDFTAYALLAVLIVYEHAQYRPLLAGAFVVAAALLVLAGNPRLPDWLDAFARRRSGTAGAGFSWISDLLRASRRMLRPRLLLPGLLLGLMSWGAEGLGFWLVCHSLGIELKVLTATSIYAIAGLAGAAAFFMPGGIGGMEGVMTLLLKTAGGATTSVALVATLLCRLATLWFAVVVGFLCTTALELINWRPQPRPSS